MLLGYYSKPLLSHHAGKPIYTGIVLIIFYRVLPQQLCKKVSAKLHTVPLPIDGTESDKT